MTGELSIFEGASDEYLVEVSDAMRKYIRNNDEQALRFAEDQVNQKPGLWSRLLPTKYERERQAIATRQLRQIADNKEAMLALYSETQLEIARKQSDALVATVGLELSQNVSAFAAQKIAELGRDCRALR